MSAGSFSSAICRIGRDGPLAKRRCQEALSLIILHRETRSGGHEMIGSPEVLADSYLRTIGNVRRHSATRDDPFEARVR